MSYSWSQQLFSWLSAASVLVQKFMQILLMVEESQSEKKYEINSRTENMKLGTRGVKSNRKNKSPNEYRRLKDSMVAFLQL